MCKLGTTLGLFWRSEERKIRPEGPSLQGNLKPGSNVPLVSGMLPTSHSSNEGWNRDSSKFGYISIEIALEHHRIFNQVTLLYRSQSIVTIPCARTVVPVYASIWSVIEPFFKSVAVPPPMIDWKATFMSSSRSGSGLQ